MDTRDRVARATAKSPKMIHMSHMRWRPLNKMRAAWDTPCDCTPLIVARTPMGTVFEVDKMGKLDIVSIGT